MSDDLSKVISDILGDAANGLAQSTSNLTLDDISFHDFAKYEFLLNPEDYRRLDTSALSKDAINYIDDLESAGSSIAILEYMADLLMRLEAAVHRGFEEGLPTPIPSGVLIPNPFELSTNSYLPRAVLRLLYTLHRRLFGPIVNLDRAIPDFISFHLFNDIKQKAQKMATKVLENPNLSGQGYANPLYDWVFFVEETSWWAITPDLKVDKVNLDSDLEYPFDFYPPGSVNVGISLVYRQRWKTIGIQPGEIVKTIPLGPGQSEKVLTKITRRRKTTGNTETTTSSEINSESTDTTKDSTEVVNEAASQQNWSLSASASYGIGGLGFGGSASGEMDGSKENSSKETTSSLSEMMKKTASKIRRQTKVNITTELESSFEESTTSEVKNNNDEVPLTLQYHMLQHQYEVYTYLFSVKNVIFVAEKIPAPYEVNLSWVRRYDWIIAQELKDESFRNILNELIQDENTEPLIGFGDEDDHYTNLLYTAKDKFADFNTPGNPNGLGGLSVPDIYAEPQRQFDQFRKGEEQRKRANKIRGLRRNRLLDHIRDNILHYCRAIWAREDAEQRMFRYKKEGRTVPFIWQGPIIQEGNASNFQPTEVRVAIGDIIRDINPIGFTGNYVVFGLSSPDRDFEELVEVNTDVPAGSINLPLFEILNILKSTYTNASGTALQDPALDFFIEEAEQIDENDLRTLSDDVVIDFLSFLPHLNEVLIDQNEIIRNLDGTLKYTISKEEWGNYLFKKNATRRFLVDSNNLYISLLLGNGVALEPFKRAHRFIDVLKADEERKAEILKNERREVLKNTPNSFDPDIAKVVIASGAKAEDLIGGQLNDD